MVVAGRGTEDEDTESAEIIDLDNSNFKCPSLPSLPKAIFGAFGGLIHDDQVRVDPMICGGNAQNQCYTLKRAFGGTAWINSLNLSQPLSYTNAVESPYRDCRLFTVGGFNGSAIKTSFSYCNNTWTVSAHPLPVAAWLHCTIKFDDTTVMVTGGVQSFVYSRKTYMLNTSERTGWIKGNATVFQIIF